MSKRVLNLSIINKLSLVTVLYFVLMAWFLVLSIFGMYLLSAARSYVGAEGLWSKNQKDTIYYLNKYASSKDEAEYQKYLEAIKVPLGDRKARLEIIKEDGFNRETAYQGFIEGKNRSEDVGGMVFLFRNFQQIEFIQKALYIWTAADEHIDHILKLGEKLHQGISSESISEQEIGEILQQLDIADRQVRTVEDNFSYTIGEASRWLIDFLNIIMILTVILVGALGFFFSTIIFRDITRRIEKLKLAAEKMAGGDFAQRVEMEATDEISDLTDSFNKMTEDLGKSQRATEDRARDLEKSKKELQAKMEELEKFNKLVVGRELRMIELKGEIKELKEKLNKTKPTSISG